MKTNLILQISNTINCQPTLMPICDFKPWAEMYKNSK